MKYINPRRTYGELEEWCIWLEDHIYYAKEEGREEREERLLALLIAVENELGYRIENQTFDN